MNGISIQADLSELQRATQLLKAFPGRLKQAVDSGIKKATSEVKRTIVPAVTHEYTVKAARVRKAITTKGGLRRGQILVRGKRMNISEFHISPKRAKNPQHGLHVNVRRDTGVRVIKRGFLMPVGGRNIAMMRTGPGRYGIRPVQTAAVPQMMKNEQVQEQIIERGREAFIEGLRLFTGNFLAGRVK